jgi:hypothetical protein
MIYRGNMAIDSDQENKSPTFIIKMSQRCQKVGEKMADIAAIEM